MAPPSAQAPSAPAASPARAATTEGLTKMPEPMMPPITISVTSASPSLRSSAGAAIRASYGTTLAGARPARGQARPAGSVAREQHRSGHGARGADAHETAARVAPLHLVGERGEDAPA